MESVKKDFSKAATIYRSTCDDYKFSRSCHKYGGYALTGKGCTEDHPAAFSYYQKGCSLGEGDSCFYAGLMKIAENNKIKVQKDYPEGMALLNQSCDKGNDSGCYYLSGLYLTGVQNVLEKDMSKAFEFSTKACELGNIFACSNLSQMYTRGDGVKKSKDMAEKFQKKAKDLEQQLQAKFKPIEMEQGTWISTVLHWKCKWIVMNSV